MTPATFSQIVTLIEATRGFTFTPAERQSWFAVLAALDDADAQEGAIAALRQVEGRLLPAHIWNRGMEARRNRKLPPPPALEAQNVTDEQAAENRQKIAEAARGLFRPIT